MKFFRILIFFLVLPLSIVAHPGIGLVYDGNQTIYYTDLVHIWKLNTQTVEASIFLENLHSQELWLDDDGTLYGEHYWYDEPNEIFKHYIWMATPDGEISKISDTIIGENDHFSFVRNSIDHSYRIARSDNGFDVFEIDSTSESVLLSTDFNDPAWLFLTNQSNLLIVDYPSLHSISLTDTNHTILTNNLTETGFPFSFQDNHHHIYGAWTDTESNVYVAIYGGRQVIRVNEQLNQETVLETSFFWSPVNGVFDSNNDLWLMEATMRGKVRVRKVTLT